MDILRASLFWAGVSALLLCCNDGAEEALDAGAGGGGAADAESSLTEAGMPGRSDGGAPAMDAGDDVPDTGVADAAPSGPECLEVQDCDAVCEWFVECSVTQCPGYDRTSSQPLDELCRSACEVLADVLCNHRQCGETIDYISGLDPNGAYATACADADRDPASP